MSDHINPLGFTRFSVGIPTGVGKMKENANESVGFAHLTYEMDVAKCLYRNKKTLETFYIKFVSMNLLF